MRPPNEEGLRDYGAGREWSWPREPLLYLTDLHADPDALRRSLERAGHAGERVVLGGDLIDKGPDDLGLLDEVAALRARAPVELLLGNHDLRFLLALHALEREDPTTAHLPVRLGRKGLGLLRALYRAAGSPSPASRPKVARRRLLPGRGWPEEFARRAPGLGLSGAALQRELGRARRKEEALRAELDHGEDFGWGELEAALELARAWFLDPAGRYAWLATESRFAWEAGAFLFVHAGLCDEGAALAGEGGAAALEARYQELRLEDPGRLYFGPLGNALRTKYRPAIDAALGAKGAAALRARGVHALVTGHRPGPAPRLALYGGVLHVDGDACLDRVSRAQRQLPLEGAGGVWLRPDGSLELVGDAATVRLEARRLGWQLV
ncbi:MAG: metallophosphoesterase [Planctomycetota bacterium]